MRRRTAFLAAVALTAFASAASAGWKEEDFPPRPVVAHSFDRAEGAEQTTVVGTPSPYLFRPGDTLWDVARHLGLGINEVQEALPDVDVWVPPVGETVEFPTHWILPESEDAGLVINVPEMRLYYFDGAGSVITYAVGLGRDDWQTPSAGHFKIREKTKDPTWVIPESIRQERIRDKGLAEKSIAGGDPQNPLGRYRMRTTVDLYGIHGTNIAWGVGMRVSHGCIRLYPEDIEQLFPLVPVGTPGEFVYQPVKLGALDGDVYVEVHRDIYDMGFDYWNEARSLLQNHGWDAFVDWGAVAAAIDRKSGVATRISNGKPLLRAAAEPAEVDAQSAALEEPLPSE